MVGEDVGDAMCMARRRLEEAAYAFWFLGDGELVPSEEACQCERRRGPLPQQQQQCDICRWAAFDNFEECVDHEKACGAAAAATTFAAAVAGEGAGGGGGGTAGNDAIAPNGGGRPATTRLRRTEPLLRRRQRTNRRRNEHALPSPTLFAPIRHRGMQRQQQRQQTSRLFRREQQ